MKKIILIVVSITITAVSFCQEKIAYDANYYANKNDSLFEDFNSKFGKTGEIQNGESLVIMDGYIGPVSFGNMTIRQNSHRAKVKTKSNQIGWLYTDSISIIDSKILPVEITSNAWTNSYYLDVLKSEKKETLFIYEPFWRDHYRKYNHMFNENDPRRPEWYEIAYIPQLEITNIYATLNFFPYNEYIIIFEKISETNGKFSFSVICTNKNILFKEIDTRIQFPLNEKFTMTLSLDGDYLDVYINGKEIFTLVKLNEEMDNQFKRLMENKSVDLTNISLPRRADGSTDYPPPVLSPITAEEDKMSQHIIDTENQTQAVVQNNAKASSLPLWAWVAVIVGIVAVVGATVTFTVLRKKHTV